MPTDVCQGVGRHGDPGVELQPIIDGNVATRRRANYHLQIDHLIAARQSRRARAYLVAAPHVWRQPASSGPLAYRLTVDLFVLGLDEWPIDVGDVHTTLCVEACTIPFEMAFTFVASFKIDDVAVQS